MAQAVIRQPLTAEARVNMRFVEDKVALGQVSLRVLRPCPVNIIPRWLSRLIVMWEMNSRPVGGRSSETQSHPTDMNNSNNSV
jgi:hypothetical protein